MNLSLSRRSLVKTSSKVLLPKCQSQHDPLKQFFVQMQQTLQQSNKHLSFIQFQQFYTQLLRQLIIKSQIQRNQSVYLGFLRKLSKIYKIDIQAEVRILMLEVKVNIQHNDLQLSLRLINRLKHILIDTDQEYLLAKLFLLEAKLYQKSNDHDMTIKTLNKSIQFAQNYLVQYLRDSQNNRKQITQCIIIANFELYKLKSASNTRQASIHLQKALSTCQRNLGQQSQISAIIRQVQLNMKQIRQGMQRINQSAQKPRTLISRICLKNHLQIENFYIWQQQKLLSLLIKTKQNQAKILQEVDFIIKLDMTKINQLKELDYVQLIEGELVINQELIGKLEQGKRQNSTPNKRENNTHTKVGLKNISKNDIIRKDHLSSSEEDASFIQKQDFNFIRKLGVRAQSAKRQDNH